MSCDLSGNKIERNVFSHDNIVYALDLSKNTNLSKLDKTNLSKLGYCFSDGKGSMLRVLFRADSKLNKLLIKFNIDLVF